MDTEDFPTGTVAVKRGAKRNKVLLAAKLRTASGEVDARLRDLSSKGALVECSHPLRVDEQVVFARGATVVPARVAWTSDGRVGLEFLDRIDETEVLVQLGRPRKPRAKQIFRDPAPQDKEPADTERARAWSAAVGLSVPGE